MATITELKRKIKSLRKKQEDLYREENELQEKVDALGRERWLNRIKKTIHTGDIFVVNEGITNYHCDAINVYEILNVEAIDHAGKRNGIPFTYTSYWVKVRTFTVHAADGDRYSLLETKAPFNNLETLLRAKKMSKEDFEDFKVNLFMAPETYDGSKWDATPKKGIK